MNLNKLKPFDNDLINVIIETPKGSQNKFDYDPKLKVFRLKKTLPMGTTFPFDFGFIPGTKAEDGDPVDVMVISDQPVYTGVLITCRILGVIEAFQTEKNARKERNDRVVAVSDCSVLYAGIRSVKELNKDMIREIENFFIDYNKHEGKKFVPVKWAGIKTATKLITSHIV